MPIPNEQPVLEQDCWYDYDDPEVLIYFLIRVKGNVVWQSSWRDVREISEERDTIADLRKEVSEACEKYGISRDLSSDDYSTWTA